MELNSEKARWNFIQDLHNKEKTQTRIQSLLNSFGNKITSLGKLQILLACNKQTNFLLKLLRESV